MEGKTRGTQEDKESARKQRESEATSKDTLSDIEHDEIISDEETGGEAAEPPAPDDAPTRRRPIDDTGPM